MRILQRIRDIQNMTLNKDGNYTVTYGYDAKGRIVTETVTGDIERITTFSYDENDNVSKEVYEDGVIVITKEYSYEPETGNITTITVTSTPKL